MRLTSLLATFSNISVTMYIVEVSFIGVGNHSTQRKPLTCRKLLTFYLTLWYTFMYVSTARLL